MTALGPGSKLGRFSISGVLGRGAMGTVFLGHDPQIDRPVAIKTLRATGTEDEQTREIEARFLKEARLAGRLQHPNVVTIYEAGQDQGVSYSAMEYVEGESLDEYLAKHRSLSIPERLSLVRQAAQALDHAHARGVLHRDIKPGNILVTPDGRAKVADFGIGKLLSDGGELTRTGQMVGSPAYMSPEQIRGEKLDGRSDFFSLAVVLYELLTGSRPFPGDSVTTLVYQILHTEPRDPRKVRGDLPPAATRVFGRLLAKSREARPKNAAEFSRELDQLEQRLSEKTISLRDRTAAAPAASPAIPPAPVAKRPAPGEKPPAPAREKTAESQPRRPVWARATPRAAALALLALGAVIAIWRLAGRGSTAGSRGGARQSAEMAGGTAAPAAPAASELPREAEVRAGKEAITPRPGGRSARGSRGRAVAEDQSASISAGEGSSRRSVDKVYRTRRFVKFGVSPDQARISVDGRYVGIVDDWDDHGGGKTLELTRGAHRVRLALPGYRSLNLEVIRTPAASDETVDVSDDLKKEANVFYPRLPKVDAQTLGPVEFRVEPPNASVREGGRILGRVSSFGPGSPLRLSGPKAHDLVISAPHHRSRTVRILVSSNAENERATVKLELERN